MTVLNPAEFASAVMAMANEVEPFNPVVNYDKDGDCVEFFARPDAFYAERIDDLVTVYCSQDSGDVIGSLVKGVGAICKRFPGLVIEIHDGKIELQHLIRAKLWSDQPPTGIRVVRYQKLIEIAEQSGAELALAL